MPVLGRLTGLGRAAASALLGVRTFAGGSAVFAAGSHPRLDDKSIGAMNRMHQYLSRSAPTSASGVPSGMCPDSLRDRLDEANGHIARLKSEVMALKRECDRMRDIEQDRAKVIQDLYVKVTQQSNELTFRHQYIADLEQRLSEENSNSKGMLLENMIVTDPDVLALVEEMDALRQQLAQAEFVTPGMDDKVDSIKAQMGQLFSYDPVENRGDSDDNPAEIAEPEAPSVKMGK